MGDLLSLVAELQEEVERIRSIRESEKETGWWNQALPSLIQKQEQPPEKKQDQRDPVSSPCQAEGSSLKERSEQKQVRAQGGRQTPSLPTSPYSQVPLYNRFEGLDVEGQSMDDVDDGPPTPEVLPRSERPTPCITTNSMRKKRRVIVVGDSLLRGTEGPICRTEPPLREVCYLPGAWVKDIARKPPSLVRPSDYYLLLLFHVGGDEAATHSPRAIKRDCRALGWLVRESGAQVIFSSTLPFQLWAATLEETDGPSLLIHGSMAGVIATMLGFSIMGWPTWHQAC